MSRKGETITLSLLPGQQEELEQIALELGQTWGEKPNISKLIRAIADRKLKVSHIDKEAPMPGYQRKAMKNAIALIQEGLAKLIKLI